MIKDYVEDIYNFLNQFATPYLSNQVPANNQNLNNNLIVSYPYLTYNLLVEDYRNTGILQIRLYDKSDNIKTLVNIVDKLDNVIDDGYIYNNIVLHKGSPFVQDIEQEDLTIKCLYILLDIDFL